MEKIEQNEQWKLDGDCSICRRKSYCSKDCKSRKLRISKMVYEAVISKIFNDLNEEYVKEGGN